MKTEVPFIGKIYRIITGTYGNENFEGKCVSVNLSDNLPVILMNRKFECRAVRVSEIELIASSSNELSFEQQN